MKSRFMLDTDTVSFALRGEGRVVEHLRAHRRSDLSVSSITVAELRFGAAIKQSNKINSAISAFLADMPVLAFDESAAEHFAEIGGVLSKRGRPIGSIDTLIAAHARSLGYTLVSNNTRHFDRVPGLTVETWF